MSKASHKQGTSFPVSLDPMPPTAPIDPAVPDELLDELELLANGEWYDHETKEEARRLIREYAREERLDEWNWISENMPYTDQGRLFEERARLRIAELTAEEVKDE